MNRLALVGYLAFALVAVSLVNRLAAQTTPVAGLTSTAVITGSTGPPSLFASGSAAAPSIAFSANPSTGFYLFSTGNFVTAVSGANTILNNGAGLVLTSAALYRWGNTDALGTVDTGLGRNAAGVVEVNNGTAGQRASLTTNNGGGIMLGATTFAALNANAVNGTVVYCSDCAIGASCAGAGSGAIAKRLAAAWSCT